ncbi:MAG TPA: cation-translocating P-type ATPase, partial [Phycisphaerales bacterium]|nr:cation-translocating P-type ATPase [Phycisphaerales bacterium]
MTAGPATGDLREEAMRGSRDTAADAAREEEAKRGFVERLMGPEWHLAVGIAAGIFLAAGYVLWKWGTWGAAELDGWRSAVANTGVGLCWASLGLGSIHGVRAAWKSLKKFKPDIDVLMVVGAFLSAAIGHVEEGALLLVMFTIAGALEERALARTRDAVTRLSKLMPTSALKRERGEWVSVEPERLSAGDVVLVRPGELVPADGVVEQGRSSVDQSMLTGESFPRTVTEGEQVFAGTVNHAGALEVRVTRRVEESSLKRILELVTEAHETRRPLQRMVDRLSTPYTLVVILGSAASFFVFWKLWPAMDAVDAIYRSITLLVVASPCALVLATPTATLCGLSRAARAGVLVKGGDALERLARVEHIALDKTGTLTTGQIEVKGARMFGRVREEEMLGIARSAEEQSTHPIAQAIVREAKRRGAQRVAVKELTNVEGKGVEGLADGERVRIGTLAFCEELIEDAQIRDVRAQVEGAGENAEKAVVMAYRGSAMVFALADEVREHADELAERLREAGVKSVTMLSGDSQEIAEHVGSELGIRDVRGG